MWGHCKYVAITGRMQSMHATEWNRWLTWLQLRIYLGLKMIRNILDNISTKLNKEYNGWSRFWTRGSVTHYTLCSTMSLSQINISPPFYIIIITAFIHFTNGHNPIILNYLWEAHYPNDLVDNLLSVGISPFLCLVLHPVIS